MFAPVTTSPSTLSMAQPTWKLGLKFLWGPRPHFYYPFGPGLDTKLRSLPKAVGFFCRDEIEDAVEVEAAGQARETEELVRVPVDQHQRVRAHVVEWVRGGARHATVAQRRGEGLIGVPARRPAVVERRQPGDVAFDNVHA